MAKPAAHRARVWRGNGIVQITDESHEDDASNAGVRSTIPKAQKKTTGSRQTDDRSDDEPMPVDGLAWHARVPVAQTGRFHKNSAIAADDGKCRSAFLTVTLS
jgi:hypothetical protein